MDLWIIVVLMLEVIWNPKSIKFGVEFGCVFGMILLSGFRMVLEHVLGDFLVPKR